MKKQLFFARNFFLLLLVTCLALPAFSQKEEKEKKEKKKFSLKTIGEGIGDLTGKLMTKKTDNLAEAAPIASIISGIYDPNVGTSEAKYFPEDTYEGDYMVSITFMKNEGVGLLAIDGEVTCNGKPMEYVSMGSYLVRMDEPITEPQTLHIKTASGDEATFVLNPIPEIEILSINDDATLPIIDLQEDMKIAFTNPPGSENTTIHAGLLTKVMGATAFNYFADFPAKKTEVTIPHEAFSNLEISGGLGAGNVNKGNTYIVLKRELRTEKGAMGPEQKPGNVGAATIQAQAYSSKQVIVKGKQENGVIANLRFSGRQKGELGFDISKPNARSGIPFSRGSNFGLASLTVNGQTYKRESTSGSNSTTIGNTRYTTTWTRTTTYEFPQLPDAHWEAMMEDFYTQFTAMMQEEMNIAFVPVEKVTGTADYHTLFGNAEVNSRAKISHAYKNTLRVQPKSIAEIFGNLSSSKSNENTATKMMTEAGIDGLVSIAINFTIGADRNDKVILIPSVRFSMSGMDETKDKRQGTYADGYVTYQIGIPFNGDQVKSDPAYLSRALNISQMVDCLRFMLKTLHQKEVEMGYDKIWSIGE